MQYSEKHSGFTLVEVLFALFFLTIGVFGVYSLIINNERVVEASKNIASALMLGEQGLVIGETKATLLNSNQNATLQTDTNINDLGTTAPASEQSFTRTISQCGTTVYSQVIWTDTLGAHNKTFTRPLILNGAKYACSLPNFP